MAFQAPEVNHVIIWQGSLAWVNLKNLIASFLIWVQYHLQINFPLLFSADERLETGKCTKRYLILSEAIPARSLMALMRLHRKTNNINIFYVQSVRSANITHPSTEKTLHNSFHCLHTSSVHKSHA